MNFPCAYIVLVFVVWATIAAQFGAIVGFIDISFTCVEFGIGYDFISSSACMNSGGTLFRLFSFEYFFNTL